MMTAEFGGRAGGEPASNQRSLPKVICFPVACHLATRVCASRLSTSGTRAAGTPVGVSSPPPSNWASALASPLLVASNMTLRGLTGSWRPLRSATSKNETTQACGGLPAASPIARR